MRRPAHSLGRLLVGLAVLAVLLVPLPASASPRPAAAPPHPLAPASPLASASVSGHGTPAVTVPALVVPSYQWALAYILYGPNDDSTHFMGEGSATVVNDATRNITTFGGEGEGGLINYTVDYNYSTGSFNVSVLNPTPPERTNASFADVPGRNFAVLFGGLTSLAKQTTVADTWIYYFTNQTWRNVTRGAAPPARESAGFAVNGSGNTALLEGGWTPTYSVNGSTASVFWNDTWSLNLTTFIWAQLHPVHAPAPMLGSGLIWQNATDRFYLFGGCALTCSATLWTFGGSPADWRAVRTSVGPGPRAAAAFQWDGEDHAALLVGGFNWGSGGAVALQDQWVYLPTSNTWSLLNIGPGPGPVYDPASSWADFPGCVGLTIDGGNTALSGPPMTSSLLEPYPANSTNCFPNLITTGGPPPPPCAGNHSSLVLQVRDRLNGTPIVNATVDVVGTCLNRVYYTGPNGYLNLTVPAPGQMNFTTDASGYHSNRSTAFIVPSETIWVNVTLLPNPSLHIRAFNDSYPEHLTPLPGVVVQEANFAELGTTGANGWLNVTNLDNQPGNVTFYGILTHHSRASTVIDVPLDGPAVGTLILEAASSLDVQAVDDSSGAGISGVAGTLTDLDPGAPRPLSFTTGPGGWFNLTILDAANYTLSAAAFGYYSNATSFDHAWVTPQTVTLRLNPRLGAVVDAYVLDGVHLRPIVGATVTFLGDRSNVTSASGWANFSNLRPPGTYEIEANATGYLTNYTYVVLDWGKVIDPYIIELSPLVPCPGSTDALCPPGTTAAPPAFGYLRGGSGAVDVLIAAPAVLLAGGILYALLGSRKSPRAAPARAASGASPRSP